MRAAVVNSFDTPPTYQDFPTPTPQTPDEVLIDVIAVGLHPRVRSQANGSHYTSSGELPLIPVRCGRDCRPRRHARRGRPAPRPDSPRRRRGHRLPLGPPHGRRDARHRENRTDRGRPLTWIEIGSVGGPTAAIPSAALRAARLQTSAADRARSRPATSWPGSSTWPPRSPVEPSRSTHVPSHSLTSQPPGTRAAAISASSSHPERSPANPAGAVAGDCPGNLWAS
jgi:hypothetical protein